MKEFLHSVAGVALCRGDNKGIPRMPCVICTARLRKRLPAPGSPPHCWFSGTHPHPGAINAGSLLCRGGVEQIYCGWSPHKGPRRCHNRARISCRRVRTVWFQVPTSHDRRCKRELCPECNDTVTKCVSSLRPTPVAHKDTLHTLHTAQVTRDAERLKPSSGPQKEISLISFCGIDLTTMNAFFWVLHFHEMNSFMQESEM